MAQQWRGLRSALSATVDLWRAKGADAKRNGGDEQGIPGQSGASPVRSLPPELLSDVFEHLSAPRLDSMEDVVRASLVCRFWRQVALSTPRMWSNVHAVLDRMDPVIVERFCARSAPLTLSVRFDSDGYSNRVDESIFFVLTVYSARIRELVVPDGNCQLLDAPHARDFLALSFPRLQTLWILNIKALPASFLDECARTLTTLCIPPYAVPLEREHPVLRNVTTFRVAQGLLTQEVLERVLALCPNLKNLVDAASFRQPALTAPRSTVSLNTLCYFDSQVQQSFPAPMLDMLNHSHITHITVLDAHPDSMALVLEPLGDIVHATFDFNEGYVELSNARGFSRRLHGCNSWNGEPFHRLCAPRSARWSLTSLTILSAIPPGFPFPPLAGLVSLTICLPRPDERPSAFARNWPCPSLAVLQLSGAAHESHGLPARLVVDFMYKRLALARLAELRLNFVRLWHAPGVECLELDCCDRVVHTSDTLEHRSPGTDIPYALDRPWDYDAWRSRRARKTNMQRY